MKQLILEIEKLVLESHPNNDELNFIIGENIMKLLLLKTNLIELKNPEKCFRKIISKLYQGKNCYQVLKYCKLVGLKTK